MTKISRLLLVVLLSLLMSASAYAAGNDANTVLLITGEEASTWANGETFTESSAGGDSNGSEELPNPNPHTVTINDGATSATGQTGFGNAISFDGDGDYLTIPDSDDWDLSSGDFTIDFWMNRTSGNGTQVILAQGNATEENHWSVVTTDSSIALIRRTSGDGSDTTIVSALTSLNASAWQHYAIVSKSSIDTYYIFEDGQLIGENETTLRPYISGATFDIGHQLHGSTHYYYTGYLDELRISKCARTEDPNDPMYIITDSSDPNYIDGVSFTPPTTPYSTEPLSVSISTDVASGYSPLEVNFTSTITGGTSPYTYSWDFDNDGVEDSTDQNPSYTYKSSGSYTATVTVTDSNSSTATDTITINVNQTLSIDSYSATPSTGTAPLTVEFSVTATGGTAPYTYAWDFDNDGIEDSTDQNPEYTYTSGYSGNANITVTDYDENIVSQNISINITELTTEDCYASYNFLSDKFHVSCFAIEGEVYRFDMTINDVEIDESSIVKIK